MSKERERILISKFLQWNDRNGSYTDENRDIENMPRMTYEDAVKYFFDVVNEDVFYKVADNIFELTYEEVIKIANENGFYDTTIEKLNLLVSEENPTEGLYRKLI